MEPSNNGHKPPIWHRRPGESIKAYEMFMYYMMLSANERNREKVAEYFAANYSTNNYDKLYAVVCDLCSTHSWVKRAKAHDEHMVDVQMQAIDKALQKDAARYAQRLIAFREEEFTTGMTLLKQANEMMKGPLYETTIDKVENINGQEVATHVTLTPAKWAKRDAASMAKVGDELVRLSLDMATSRGVLDVRLPDEKSERVAKARAVLSKLLETLDDTVTRLLLQHPGADRDHFKTQLRETWENQIAEDWKVERALLTEGEEVVDQMAAQITAGAAALNNDHSGDTDPVN